MKTACEKNILVANKCFGLFVLTLWKINENAAVPIFGLIVSHSWAHIWCVMCAY